MRILEGGERHVDTYGRGNREADILGGGVVGVAGLRPRHMGRCNGMGESG